MAQVSPTTINAAPILSGLKRYLTIRCEVKEEIGAVVDIPGGLRRKIRLEGDDANGAVGLDPAQWPSASLSTTNVGLPGYVRDGANWVFVRNDGIIVLDSRVTIGFPDKGYTPKKKGEDPPKELFLIDVTLKGVMDMSRIFACSDTDGYQKFAAGSSTVINHPMMGSVRFEAAERVSSDEDTSWLPIQLQQTAQRFGDFKPLVRQQFIAVGMVTTKQAPYYPPQRIDVEIYGV